MTRLPLSEADLQAQVVELARILGWKCNHTRRSIGGRTRGWTTATTMIGWPDLTLIRPPHLMFVELKSETGLLTPEQESVLDLLAGCDGVECHVWRPSDMASGRVQHLLDRRAR